MAISTTTIGDALFTKTQQRVLALLFAKTEQSFYLNEIVRFANIGKGSVTRVLDKLLSAGLISSFKQGNQTHYQANTHSPVFQELRGIVKKSFGVHGILSSSLHSIQHKIQLAFIYGSVAKGHESSASDIDLLVVSNELSYSDIMQTLESAEAELGRTINPTIFSAKEFKQRVDNNKTFIKRVMDQPKLWIIGEGV